MTQAVRAGQAGDAARYASLFGSGPAPRQYPLATVGNSLKWGRLEKSGRPANFSAADAAVDFLERAGAAVRGHNLVWPAHNPPWLVRAAPEMPAAELSEALVLHVAEVAGRYAGRLLSWDVVNEPLRQEAPECGPHDWGCGLLGLMHWSGAQPVDWTQVEGDLGRGSYIEVALRAARAADPEALLMLNEFDVHGGMCTGGTTSQHAFWPSAGRSWKLARPWTESACRCTFRTRTPRTTPPLSPPSWRALRSLGWWFT